MKITSKRLIKGLFFIFGIAILFCLFTKYYNDQPKRLTVSMEVKSEHKDQYAVYYDLDGSHIWNEGQADKKEYKDANKFEKISFTIPKETKSLRLDFGTTDGETIVKNLKIYQKDELVLDNSKINQLHIDKKKLDINFNGKEMIIKSSSNDSYFVINDFQGLSKGLVGKPFFVNYIIISLAVVMSFITIKALMGFNNTVEFVRESIKNKNLIINLAKNDFKQKYVSSYLGVVWGFIQPLITILVYWFVFQVGFRSANVGDLPYVVWFTAGIVPWFFFSEGLSACTNVFMEYSYLVKKVLFKIETLPIIKILSTLFVHCFFILFLVAVTSAYGYYPDLYVLQVFYYLFAMIVLVYSLTIFTSAVVLFFRDLAQIINIIINVGFWATPIGWMITMLPETVQKIFKLNPVFYIVTGYRDAFVEKIFFWQRPYHTLYFWCFCGVILLISVKVFNKLRPHFSDVI